MKVKRGQGMGMSKGARAKTYLHNREGVPTKGRKAASPSRLSPPTFSRSSSSLLAVASQAALPSSSGSIGLFRRQQHWQWAAPLGSSSFK